MSADSGLPSQLSPDQPSAADPSGRPLLPPELPPTPSRGNCSSLGSRPLPAKMFYGVILCGATAGVVGAVAGSILAPGSPQGRGIWDEQGLLLLRLVAAMAGGTFGGIAGVAAASLLDMAIRRFAAAGHGKSRPMVTDSAAGESLPQR